MKTNDKKLVISCDVLFENLQLLKQSSDIQFEELTMEKMWQFSQGLEKTFHSLDIHRDSFLPIVTDFEISDSDIEKLQTGLKSASFLYLLYFVNGLNHNLFEKYLKRVDKISKAAEKLRDLLNAGGNDFALFLEWVNHYEEKDEGEPTANKFLHDTVNMLNILISIRWALPESEIGKAGLYKGRGRPKNRALNIWVYALHSYWVNVLGRSMERESTGLSGRKKFLEFLDRCIEPLHPEMMSYNSDALDTALKELQKKLKRGEKPLKIWLFILNDQLKHPAQFRVITRIRRIYDDERLHLPPRPTHDGKRSRWGSLLLATRFTKLARTWRRTRICEGQWKFSPLSNA